LQYLTGRHAGFRQQSRYFSVSHGEARNTSPGIWSLGVVFLEMVILFKGQTVDHIDKIPQEHGSPQALIRSKHVGFLELITELKYTGSEADNVVIEWTQDILVMEL
jgi:hypothetical protein